MTQIHFEGLDLNRKGPTGSAIVRFRLSNEDDGYVATIPIGVAAHNDGLEGMLARAHNDLATSLRDWADQLDVMALHYAKEAARYSQAR